MAPSRHALTLNLLSLLILPAILCLTAFGVTSAIHRRGEIETDAVHDLEDYVDLLAGTLPALATRLDDAALVTVLERMAQHQQVHGIALYDRHCRVLARSRQSVARASQIDAIACAAGSSRRPRRARVSDGDIDLLVQAQTVEGRQSVGIIAVGYELTEVREAIRDTTVRLAIASVLFVAVMGGVALMIARRVGGSLSDLLHGVGKVAGGDLTARVAERGMFGTALVAHGFNRMTEALALARSRLESAEHERRDLEQRMLHAQTLTAVGQMAASLAHDIGSPLSTILMAARMSSENASLPEPARKQFELIATQCDRVTRVVKQLLAVSRPAQACREVVDLGSVVREVIAFVQPEGRRRGVSLRADVPDAPVTAQGQRDATLQMLVNLAMNGLQAQPNGGTLVIAVRREGAKAVLEVRDAGPGIPMELRARVFEPFFSTKAPGEGTGLGMSIAATVAKDLGGSIALDDAPEGGACVRVMLPASDGETS